MGRFHYYFVLVWRHHEYGGWLNAIGFAWRHKAFWRGATGGEDPYVHIGSK